MRRFTIGSAMVLALLLMLTAVAVAAPSFCDPDNPRYDPDNKLCTTTTTSDPTTTSTTTTVPDPSTLEPCPTEKVIEVLKPGRVSYECLWTPALPEVVDGSPAGKVTVTVDNGEIGGLAIFVLDSMPGNVCELVQIDKPTEQESASFNLVDGQDTYWNTGGTDWCARYDEFGPKDDLNGPPLHVRVLFRAKGDTAVTISLTPEQAVVSG